MRRLALVLVGFIPVVLGCEDLTGPAPTAQREANPEAYGVAPGSAQDYAAPVSPAAETQPAGDAAGEEAAPASEAPAEPAPGQTEQVKAEVGVGAKGQNLQEGIITTPAKAYFQVRERLIFQQVDHALNLYRATEGRLPQTHDEFMQKVIQANQIRLPELPDGSRYVWDPAKGELMVERPR